MKLLILLLFAIALFSPVFAQSEQILITVSDAMTNVVFDGKWSFAREWKASSLNEVGSLKIRSAHQGDFVYFMLNNVSDQSYNKNSDKAMICIDTENNHSSIPDNDDFCFVAVMDRNNGFILQGGTPFASTKHLQAIENHDDFIAVGTFSDGEDRYSKIPHATYEFKIPTEIINRSNEYGLYLEVFDAQTGKKIHWPDTKQLDHHQDILPPEDWGKLISIDNSLPEFPVPMLIFALLLTIVILMQVKRKFINIYHR